ncbi:putative membrane protein At4g09580 isoform X1 [Curcuma longa]|uniref:putative membrane protein At4g09580 isoform X1 n=1 Tax=Curcuma longa TaxID=136217 RepID=UPI003D9F01DB
MAQFRIAAGPRDEESADGGAEDDSPASKRPPRGESTISLTRWEAAAAATVFLIFSVGLCCIFFTMPEAEYDKILRLPRNLSDLRVLKENLAVYARDYQAKFIFGYCSVYIFMQTFMIPGTIFLSLLAGALFGVAKGIVLIVFSATSGASSCYFLSKLVGRPLVNWMWPDKLKFFQTEIAKHREKLLNYMLFLRITPSLPNTFINLASPIVDIPFRIFFLATLVGLVPASYITARAGLALGDLKSIRDLYDMKTLVVLFLIGFVTIFPTILKRKRIHE